MLKFVDTKVVFQEIPDEVTLAINISNCPCHCEDCHSSYLAEDIGETLTTDKLRKLIDNNKGISCVAFMGGDSSPMDISILARYIKNCHNLKVGWYSGRDYIDDNVIFNLNNFDYIKIGPYIKDRGPLNNPNTNQRMYKIDHEFYPNFVDITNKFWKHED
jgi:anaerobic ribonucleoside-triphosphate reductase activating protein